MTIQILSASDVAAASYSAVFGNSPFAPFAFIEPEYVDLQAILDEALSGLEAEPEAAAAPEMVSDSEEKEFVVGRVYWDRSSCDYDTVFSIEVVRRTPKTIYTECGKTLRVSEGYNGAETVKPFGTYSMCSVMNATRFYK